MSPSPIARVVVDRSNTYGTAHSNLDWKWERATTADYIQRRMIYQSFQVVFLSFAVHCHIAIRSILLFQTPKRHGLLMEP